VIDLSTYGRPLNFTSPVVARVALEPVPPEERKTSALVTEANPENWSDAKGYRAIVTTQRLVSSTSAPSDVSSIPIIHSARQVSHLKHDDVIVAYPRTGYVRTLFRPDSRHNALLVTERCNSFCLMCSQPPLDRDDSHLVNINLEAIRLMQPLPSSLGITGGEPTLLGEDLFRIFAELRTWMPETEIHMLTNGRRFARPDFTQAFVEARHPRLTTCIPLYADNAPDHDYVVQSRGAFDQTIQGLYQLARYEQLIEIRVVLHKLTISRLYELAMFIYRNLPFAAHIALMGLEITGFTRPNLEKLWIDPFDYQQELQATVEALVTRGMNVSIYNHPLCLLPRPLWKFARQSISDWKNIFLKECEVCAAREKCGGFFKSAVHRHSTHLQPIAV
jgi:His-Xaa-Ser system radical SAM maturase HxsC